MQLQVTMNLCNETIVAAAVQIEGLTISLPRPAGTWDGSYNSSNSEFYQAFKGEL